MKLKFSEVAKTAVNEKWVLLAGTIFLATAWILDNLVVEPSNRTISKIQSHIDYIINTTAPSRAADLEVHGAYHNENNMLPDNYRHELASAMHDQATTILEGNTHIAALKTDSLELSEDDHTMFAQKLYDADSFLANLDTSALRSLVNSQLGWWKNNTGQIRNDALGRKRELTERIEHSHILIVIFIIMGALMVNYDKVTEYIHSKRKYSAVEPTTHTVDKKGNKHPVIKK
jgi:hypothetical protein